MSDINSTPLYQMASSTRTDYWNDSCSTEELTYAIERGAVGATTNPTIVLNVLKKELPQWQDRILQIIHENPTWSEDEVVWELVEEMAVQAAALLMPIFKESNGKEGRLSIQTNPKNYRNTNALVEQAMHFHSLAPNLQIKVPATSAGVKAIEEITYQGGNINATVSFSVPQVLAVAEAVERGLNRRASEGKETQSMTPVCTIMVGRLDDWLQVVTKKEGVLVDPGIIAWSGVAVFKRAYKLLCERHYRTRLLAAAYRHHMHWSEFIGGDVILTIPHAWQVLFNQSKIPVIDRMDDEVDPKIIQSLQENFPDFCRAYERME